MTLPGQPPRGEEDRGRDDRQIPAWVAHGNRTLPSAIVPGLPVMTAWVYAKRSGCHKGFFHKRELPWPLVLIEHQNFLPLHSVDR